MRSLIKRIIFNMARRSKFIINLATMISRHASSQSITKDSYMYLRDKFINNGKNSQIANESIRENIVKQFERIDQEVPIATTSTDGLFIAEMMLNIKANGAIVECGCYAGGSSAKLSLLTKILNRKLIIFDSFEGLPVVDKYYLRDHHCRRNDDWVTDWSKGRYAARINEVKSNIERYGDLSCCSLVKGWFNETLTRSNLPEQVSFAFVDVDLANSARDCFVAIWPLLTDHGIYVTHDSAYIKVLQELYNHQLWKEQFKSMPPIIFGAGYGLCNESPHIGYMVKGETLSSEYLKSLTIDK